MGKGSLKLAESDLPGSVLLAKKNESL